jgi:hypothetical protein
VYEASPPALRVGVSGRGDAEGVGVRRQAIPANRTHDTHTTHDTRTQHTTRHR